LEFGRGLVVVFPAVPFCSAIASNTKRKTARPVEAARLMHAPGASIPTATRAFCVGCWFAAGVDSSRPARNRSAAHGLPQERRASKTSRGTFGGRREKLSLSTRRELSRDAGESSEKRNSVTVDQTLVGGGPEGGPTSGSQGCAARELRALSQLAHALRDDHRRPRQRCGEINEGRTRQTGVNVARASKGHRGTRCRKMHVLCVRNVRRGRLSLWTAQNIHQPAT
jgi:hypothetical protein